MEKETLEAFAEAVKTKAFFTIGNIMYAAVPMGKGRIIYGTALEKDGLPEARETSVPAAVTDAEGTVHVLNGYSAAHLCTGDAALPEGMKRFDAAETRQAAGLALLDMIDAIPVYGTVLSGDGLRDAENYAWELALNPGYVRTEPRVPVTEDDHLRVLLGADTPAGLAERHLAENRERYAMEKAVREKALELTKQHEGNEEARLYRSIAGTDAKFLSVTFAREGLTASGKIPPDRIRSEIRAHSYFSDFDFQTKNAGKKVLDALFGVKTGHWNDRLYPSDITEVRYGKEILFTRKDTERGAA